MTHDYDICIAGGGLAGASLACSLAGRPLHVAVFEQHPFNTGEQPSYDDRGLALSLSSCRILDAIGLWPRLAPSAAPVRHIHVSDKGNFGFVRFHAGDLGLEAMGYVVAARDLGGSLLEKITTLENIDYFCPAVVSDVSVQRDQVVIGLNGGSGISQVSCRLLVAADGSHSRIRDKIGLQTESRDYGQTAIVSNITPERHHDFTAYERFTGQGPLAMLPMADRRCVSIFTVPGERRDEYLNLEDTGYLEVLQRNFGGRLGRLLRMGARKSYPLMSIHASIQARKRVALLGNAAHTVHPNGAQGFNLGLRDVAALAETLIEGDRKGLDPGCQAVLDHYCRARLEDQTRVIRFTDGVGKLFYSDAALKKLGRSLGMLLLDASPRLKNNFARLAMGVYGRQPGLARGLRLDQL